MIDELRMVRVSVILLSTDAAAFQRESRVSWLMQHRQMPGDITHNVQCLEKAQTEPRL